MKELLWGLVLCVLVLGVAASHLREERVEHVVDAPAPRSVRPLEDDAQSRHRSRRQKSRKSRSDDDVISNHLQPGGEDWPHGGSLQQLENIGETLRGMASDMTSLQTQLSNFKFEHQMLHEQVSLQRQPTIGIYMYPVAIA